MAVKCHRRRAWANGEIGPRDADDALENTKPGEFVLLQMEISTAAIEAALARQGKSVVSVLNAASMSADAARLSAAADAVVANETEFEMLVGQPPRSREQRQCALESLHAQSGQTLVVTLDADGAMACIKGECTAPKYWP